MHQRSKVAPKAWRAEWYLVLVALGLGFAFWPSSERSSVTQGVQEAARERDAVELVSRGRGQDARHAPLSIGTMPIQSIAMGQRVLGEDPLIDDAERAGWVEPQWDQWLQISLVMRKDTGDELRIELLRPEEWLTQHWHFVANRPDGWCVTAMDAELAEDATAGLTPLLDQCGTPWRAYRQEMAATALELAATGYELVGLTLELDLHEIGAVGEAMVLDIQPAPPVRSGAGRVVTGKFSHKSGDVIDLVLAGADRESETIGTTSNHPFWSEDRRDYVQAGSLEEGERVLTFAGDTKRVVSKLPRPGPQPVYNLEVHGEHVYHVGKDGVLVHNEYTKDFGGGVSYRDSLDEIGAPSPTAVVDKSYKLKIHGTAQRTGTDGHQFRMYREAITEAKKPNVTSVHLDHGYNRALGLDPKTISPNLRPDVVSIYDDNTVLRIEVQSRTDVPRRLRSRNSALDPQLIEQGYTPLPTRVVRPNSPSVNFRQ